MISQVISSIPQFLTQEKSNSHPLSMIKMQGIRFFIFGPYFHGILHAPLRLFYDVMLKAMLHLIMFHTSRAHHHVCILLYYPYLIY